MAAPPGRLAENILYFARSLRAAGIPVGPGAVLDALEALNVAHIGRRDDFYWTLHAVFVKRQEHTVIVRPGLSDLLSQARLHRKVDCVAAPGMTAGAPKAPPPGAQRIQDALFSGLDQKAAEIGH